MKSYFLILGLALVSTSHASIEQAPPDFAIKDAMAVFVDFSNATHELTYDLNNQTVSVESVIEFESFSEGYPIFDLVPEAEAVSVDGIETSTELATDPEAQTSHRIIGMKLAAGEHVLKIRHKIITNVVYDEAGVASAFWLSDLTDRKYLEQYLPSNLEYDQHPRNLKVNLLGAEGLSHVLKANGKVTKLSETSFEVSYPENYTSSSAFFHLFPNKPTIQNVQFYYPSVSGKLLPVDIYTTVDILPFVKVIMDVLNELEADYGSFPHDQLIIHGYSLLRGGMEYSGATSTALQSVGHELFHSYNARGVMPANGNAGWIDEAISKWRDNKYPHIKDLTFESSQIGGHSKWRRFTDRMAYTEGAAFISRMAFRMIEKGVSLKEFLKSYFEKNMFSTVTTEEFEAQLTHAAGFDLSDDFNRYIYGKVSSPVQSVLHSENPDHPHMSKDDLLKITMP